MIRFSSSLEPLESRIAPATLPIINPLPSSIVAGSGQDGATIELGAVFDPNVVHPNHTILTFTVNLDSDPNTPGLQESTFVMELFDDEAPLTVQNFLAYVNGKDYEDTFFHRSVSGFVVQGGGFSITTPTKHIAIDSEVHNEFSASRSNLLGTVAMAKTGNGPHTATSEWFVNMADNSSNLDNQNGGFTVFGQIISGLDVFTKINTLQTASLGGGLTEIPVKSTYNSDPDHNPFTPAPKPTVNQLITITSVTKNAPTGNAAEYTYSVISNSNSDLVTTEVVGDATKQLELHYVATKSGEADITIRASVSSGDFVDQTIHVTVLPNLIANILTDTLPNIIVPGDIGKATIKLTNNGSGTYGSNATPVTAGNVDVRFYLSREVSGTEPSGTVFGDGDILVGEKLDQPVNLAGGTSMTISVPLVVPQSLFATEGVGYHLIARVTPSDPGTTTPELFAAAQDGDPADVVAKDDNTAVDGHKHALANRVGKLSLSGGGVNYGSRVVPRLTIVAPDLEPVVISLSGPGVVDLIPGKNEAGVDEFNLSVTGTSISSILAIRGQGGTRVDLHNIDIAGPIGVLNLAGADIDGYTTISGGVKTLSLGSLRGNHTLLIGSLLPANNIGATIQLGQVENYNLESDQPIAQLTAINWHDTSGDDDHIIAPSIKALNIKGAPAAAIDGNFEADVLLEGRATMNLFRVAGFFHDATFTALKTGGVTTVSVGGMDGAGFFVGTDDRPTVLGDFTKFRSIGTFTVTGAAAADPAAVFIDSQVAAGTIGAIKLLRVGTTNGTDFGFVADKIAKYVRTGKPVLTGLNAAGTFDEEGDYSVTIL